MVLELIWTAGELLSIVALLCGAYLTLMESLRTKDVLIPYAMKFKRCT